MSSDIIIGLDLGSHSFRGLAVRGSFNDQQGPEILAAYSVSSAGIRRGQIITLEDASSALAVLRENLEKKLSSPLARVFAAIGGPHIGSLLSRGLVVVSRPDSRIGQNDIDRALEAAGAIALNNNTEVLDIMPREFFIDGEGGVKDAQGMQGRRLEVDAVVLTIGEQHLKNLKRVLTKSGINDYNFSAGVLAASRAVLTPRQRELGVALVDIGHGTTDVAVFEDGQLLSLSVLPIGGMHLTNDIAIGMRCSIDVAEKIKHDYASARAQKISKRDMFEIPNGEENVSFSRRELAEITDARLDEIFELVSEELKKINRWRFLPAGVVLTGGSANIPGIVDLAKDAFHLPVQLGYSLAVSGPKDVVSGFSYVTALGLALRAGDDYVGKRKYVSSSIGQLVPKDVGSKLGRFFRALMP